MDTKETKEHHERVNERFRQLMLHDPIVIDFQKRLGKLFDDNPNLKQGFHVLEFPPKMREIYHQINKKWNVPLLEFAQFGTGIDSTQKILHRISELKPSHWKPIDDAVAHLKKRESEHLYLDIDLTTLDMNDARAVKRQVWQMVQHRIQKKRTDNPSSKRTRQAHYKNDRPELAFVYHIKGDTFQKYLRWYTIHQNEKFSFRIIAYIEKEKKAGAASDDELVKRLSSRRIKLGKPVKGEDAVEKGVKLIHRAIHGSDYDEKDFEIIDKYDCPIHGNSCPPNCDYRQDWMGRFNRLIAPEPFRMGRGQTESEFESMIHPEARSKRQKPSR